MKPTLTQTERIRPVIGDTYSDEWFTHRDGVVHTQGFIHTVMSD